MYSDHFQVGDVISFSNTDQPGWVAGNWRVKFVSLASVRIQPLNDDLSVDVARDMMKEYFIRGGGVIERERQVPTSGTRH